MKIKEVFACLSDHMAEGTVKTDEERKFGQSGTKSCDHVRSHKCEDCTEQDFCLKLYSVVCDKISFDQALKKAKERS